MAIESIAKCEVLHAKQSSAVHSLTLVGLRHKIAMNLTFSTI